MKRRELGVIMKSCVAVLSAAVVLTAMPAQVNAAPTKSVTVSTQKSLNNALKNSKVGTITIKTNEKKNFSIPKGKFTSKSIVMNSTKASLTNSGSLKGLSIKNAATVTEKADNNKIIITDKGLKFNVAKGAANSKISIGTKGAKVTVVADGNVASVSVSKKATVTLTGKTTKAVTVTSTAAGTGLILSAKANVALKEITAVTVKNGANIGTVTAYKNATVNVAKGAKVGTFNSTGDKSSVKLDVDGTVGNVVLKKKATVAITGDTTKPVAVTNNASGSWLRLYAKANVNLNQPSTVSTYKGSDVGTITAKKDVIVRVGEGSKIGTVSATKNLTVNVGAAATVKEVKSQGEDAKVTVNTNGTVGDVIIDKKAEVTVLGKTTTPVNVTTNAADSVLSVSAASKITLNESATVNVAEGAKVESLTATKDVAVNVAAKAEVAEVVVKGTDAKVEVTANGTVGAVTIDAKAEVSIKGETDSSVVVNANVESAKINTEVKTEVNANANVDITLGEGAEGSKVVAGEDVNASVKNETKEDVTVTDSTGKDTTVDSGSTGDTKPTPAPVPSTPSVIITPTPPTTTEQEKKKLYVGLLYGKDSKNITMLFWDGTHWLSKEEIKELNINPDDICIYDGKIELCVHKNDVGAKWTVYNYANNSTAESVVDNKYNIPDSGFEYFEGKNYDPNNKFVEMYGLNAGYLKVHLEGANSKEWKGFSYSVDDTENFIPISVHISHDNYIFEMNSQEGTNNCGNIALTAEVIFSEGSNNLQVLFKKDGEYLSKDVIKKLDYKDMADGFSITDNGTKLCLNTPCNKTWTIHKNHDDVTENENIHSECKVNASSDGYDVFEAWQWDGKTSGGALTSVEGVNKDTGYLKINLQGEVANSWTNGFSQDFNGNNVIITYTKTNYNITIKNFGGTDRPTQSSVTEG